MNDTTAAVRTTLDGGIATLTLNRPQARNAMTPELLDGLSKALRNIRADGDIDVLILTGSSGVFCAGGDIKGMVERHSQGGLSPAQYRQRIYAMHEWLQMLRTLEIPVIAAVDGAAYGAGFGLALAADFILCTPEARFCSVFCRIGGIPDCGVLFALPRMVGMQRAKEIMVTGRPVEAAEAKALGIAMEIHSADELGPAARTLAKRLAKSSRVAFAITKRITNQAFDNDYSALVEMEAAGQAIAMNDDYHRDAIARFVDKRPLRFNWEAADIDDD